MENLEKLGVQEINESSVKEIQGGSWVGYFIGKVLGSGYRYQGPAGIAQLQIDAAVARAM